MRRRATGEMSEIHQKIPNPEKILLQKEQGKIPHYDLDEAERQADWSIHDGNTDMADDNQRLIEKDQTETEEPLSSQDEGYHAQIGGIVGSRRLGRYAETAKFPDRKWKRGDKHRGPEKAVKKGRRPTGKEGSEQDIVG
ncbi:MAG: hypothetical protein NUV84_02420 [Candidatus Uhrbacteria bacterium]|nr:hypothetical protein [Candidatus Uhrbacteria bacterium]